MEKKVVITKRFRNNSLKIYQYLLKEFSPKTAFVFLDRLEKRIDLISKHPGIGKPSSRRKQIRSILFTPHHQLFYRNKKNVIEILCLFDMQRDPGKRPYRK